MDIGGGTTDIAIFFKGALRYSSILTLGGNHLTFDIAIGLKTPIEKAEEVKKRYGCAISDRVEKEETVELSKMGENGLKIVSRKFLSKIIEARIEDIFTLVHQEIIKSGYGGLAFGVVLTGGSALLEGLPEMAEKILGLPVRIGFPKEIKGLSKEFKNPMYAEALGLVLYGNKNPSSRKGGIIWRIKGWFEEAFF